MRSVWGALSALFDCIGLRYNSMVEAFLKAPVIKEMLSVSMAAIYSRNTFVLCGMRGNYPKIGGLCGQYKKSTVGDGQVTGGQKKRMFSSNK